MHASAHIWTTWSFILVLVYQMQKQLASFSYGETILYQKTIRLHKIRICFLKFGPWELETHGDAVLIRRGRLTSYVQMLERYHQTWNQHFVDIHSSDSCMIMMITCRTSMKKWTWSPREETMVGITTRDLYHLISRPLLKPAKNQQRLQIRSSR